jgi:hypothetical protein
MCEGAEVSKFKTKAFIQALLKKSDLAKVCGDLNRLLRGSIRLIVRFNDCLLRLSSKLKYIHSVFLIVPDLSSASL